MTSTLTVVLAFVMFSVASIDSLASPPELSRSAAIRDAKRDIASGHIRIYFAGTEAASERGLERRDVKLVRKVARDYSLPMGCTDPQALAAIDYATAYNRAIIEHLRHAQPH